MERTGAANGRNRARGLSLAALAALALTLAFFDLGGVALLDPDESRYAESAREMIERGDYVVPYFNYEPRLKKPPLFYWEEIAAFRALGLSEFSARLPSALMYLALIGALVGFSWRTSGAAVGIRAGAILATMPLVFMTGRGAITDMSLSFFICSALLLYFLVDEGTLGGTAGAILIGVSLGLAVLTKGPVGVLTPAVAILAYHLALGEWRRLLRWKGILIATACVASLSLPWALMVIARVGYDSFMEVALRETVERYAETGLEHPHGPFFYLWTMPLVSFPWSAFLVPAAAAGAFRLFRRAGRGGSASRDRLGLYLWVWMAAMLVFFSLGKGKLATYILPLLPAAALYLAREWERWIGPGEPAAARAGDREWRAATGLLAPVVILIFLVAWWEQEQARVFIDHALSFSVISVVAVGGTLILSRRRRRGAVVALLSVTISVFYLHMLEAAGPEITRSKSLRDMARELGLFERQELRLSVYHDFHPSLVLEARRRVEKLDGEEELRAYLGATGEALVIMDVRRLAALEPVASRVLRKVGSQGDQIALKLREGATAEDIKALGRGEDWLRKHPTSASGRGCGCCRSRRSGRPCGRSPSRTGHPT